MGITLKKVLVAVFSFFASSFMLVGYAGISDDFRLSGNANYVAPIYEEVVITDVTAVSNTLISNVHDFIQPTNVQSTISGNSGQKVVYKITTHNYSKDKTYIYTGTSYDAGVYGTINSLNISVSNDAENTEPINVSVSNKAHEGTPVAPGEDFVFYVTYTLTKKVTAGEVMVNYVFKPVIYDVTYLFNNYTYAVEYITDNNSEHKITKVGPSNSSYKFAGWVNVNAVKIDSIPAKNTHNYTLTATWDNVYVIIFADVQGNVLYQEEFTSSSTKLSTQGQATVDQILAELNAEASIEHMTVSWSDYTIKGAKGDITVKAIYAYAGDLNLVPVYEQPDDGIADYYKVVAVDTLPENVLVPGSVGGVPVRIVERIANTEGENDWNNYAGSVKNVTIQEGVERLEWNSLAWTPNLTTVKLPKSLTYLAKNTFSRNDLFGNDKKTLTIEFNGTRAQWKVLTINSDSSWDGGLNKGTKVICSDGYFEMTRAAGLLNKSSWKEVAT